VKPSAFATTPFTLSDVVDIPELSLADWIVLTLVDEHATYGFAIATLTAADGDVGRAWHVPRPIVYRSLERLAEVGLVQVEATEPGQRGPQRSIVAPTAAGRSACRAWLRRPVAHVRDVRSELLVKVGLLLRRGQSPRALIAAQRKVFEPVEASLTQRATDETAFGSVLARWRLENVRAALRFLAEFDSTTPSSSGVRPKASVTPPA